MFYEVKNKGNMIAAPINVRPTQFTEVGLDWLVSIWQRNL